MAKIPKFHSSIYYKMLISSFFLSLHSVLFQPIRLIYTRVHLSTSFLSAWELGIFWKTAVANPHYTSSVSEIAWQLWEYYTFCYFTRLEFRIIVSRWCCCKCSDSFVLIRFFFWYQDFDFAEGSWIQFENYGNSSKLVLKFSKVNKQNVALRKFIGIIFYRHNHRLSLIFIQR